MQDVWVEALAERISCTPMHTHGDEVRFNCYRNSCGASGTKDESYHMYVNPVKGKFFCQRCQKGGTLEQLAQFLGMTSPEKSLTNWTTMLNNFLFGPPIKEEKGEVVVKWPDEYIPMSEYTEAYRYLVSRGITDEMIQYYQIGFGKGLLDKRLIFPDVDKNDSLVYWVARTYNTDGRKRAKYRNADAPRELQVYNLGRAEKAGHSQLVICEGPISAIIAGKNAVATYGKYVTRQQVEKLASYRASEYVIAGDGDGVHAAVALATRLWRKRLNVKFARFFGREDPASVGQKEAQERIRNALPWSQATMLEVLV